MKSSHANHSTIWITKEGKKILDKKKKKGETYEDVFKRRGLI